MILFADVWTIFLFSSIRDVSLPAEVAIKVFKTTLNEFKTREKYVHGDHRFSKDDYKKQNPRKIIKMWAMKETANLNRSEFSLKFYNHNEMNTGHF